MRRQTCSQTARRSAALEARLLMRRTSNCGAALAGAARAGGSSSSSSRRDLPPPASVNARSRQRGTPCPQLRLRAPLPPPLPPLAYSRTAAQASLGASGRCSANPASGVSARNTRSEALRARGTRLDTNGAYGVLATRRACSARDPRGHGLRAATSQRELSSSAQDTQEDRIPFGAGYRGAPRVGKARRYALRFRTTGWDEQHSSDAPAATQTSFPSSPSLVRIPHVAQFHVASREELGCRAAQPSLLLSRPKGAQRHAVAEPS